MTIHKVSSLLISEVCELLFFILVSFNSRVKTNLVHLDLGHHLHAERFEVSWVLRVWLSAGWTQTILLYPQLVPAEPTDLVSTGAGEEVDVVQLEQLHAERTLWSLITTQVQPRHGYSVCRELKSNISISLSLINSVHRIKELYLEKV